MLDLNMTCFPWDLVDGGVGSVLDRLKGETGLTGISVPACTPAIEQFRPHTGVSPRTFRSAGGLHFQPRASLYAATRVQPVVADWLRKRDPLTGIAEACRTRGLTFRLRLFANHAPVMVQKSPSAAVKDVFGDPSVRWMCPANPDVREYLRAMIEDLTGQHAPAIIELDALGFPPGTTRGDGADWQVAQDSGAGLPAVTRGGGTGLQPVGATPSESPPSDVLVSYLRRLCFCESCRQRAVEQGVDAASAARSVLMTLERLLNDEEPPTQSPAEFLAADPIVEGYVNWQSAQVNSLLASLRKACGCGLVLGISGDRFACGYDGPALREQCDAIRGASGAPEDETLKAVVTRLKDLVGGTDRVELSINAGAVIPDAAALVRSVKTAADMGVRAISIDHYGEIPLRRLTWIRQASRYARRER